MIFLILFGIAMVVSSIGFKKFVYFISLGYGFSIAAIGIAMIIIFRNNLQIQPLIFSILLIIYGLRLGLYLLIREIKSSSYKATMKNDIKDGSNMNFFLKIIIWVACALLYVCEASPVLFRFQNGIANNVCGTVGLIITTCGVILESVADFTKNKFKKANPKRFCDVGVFKFVRCPNYLGEVLTWTGILVSGFTALQGPLQWIATIGGWICIVYVMFGGARRLELRQNKNYGDNPEYQSYVKKVPILLPFIPLYSVAKYKWLLG